MNSGLTFGLQICLIEGLYKCTGYELPVLDHVIAEIIIGRAEKSVNLMICRLWINVGMLYRTLNLSDEPGTEKGE